MEIKQIGNLAEGEGTFHNPQRGRVYSTQGIAPTIYTYGGGNLEPKILEKTYEMPGKNFNQRNTVHGEDAVCRTILGCGHAGNEPKVLIKQATEKGYIECEEGGVADLSFPNSRTRRGRVQEGGRVSPALTATGSTEIYKIENCYRIRKLTPRECGRLMDVTDDDITRMMISKQTEIKAFFDDCEKKGIRYKGKREFNEAERIQKMSNSQLYKQFGNSIVKRCMVAMFSNLNIQGLPKWDDIKGRYI